MKISQSRITALLAYAVVAGAAQMVPAQSTTTPPAATPPAAAQEGAPTRAGAGGGGGGNRLLEADTDKDGMLTKEEWAAAGLPEPIFGMFDADADGKLTQDEVKAGRERMRQRRAGGE